MTQQDGGVSNSDGQNTADLNTNGNNGLRTESANSFN